MYPCEDDQYFLSNMESAELGFFSSKRQTMGCQEENMFTKFLVSQDFLGKASEGSQMCAERSLL